MTGGELAKRADECLGTSRPAAKRTPEQAARLRTIVDVLNRSFSRGTLGSLNFQT
jgi:hypothetical protein